MKRIRLITIIFSIIFSFFITSVPAFAAEDMMDNLLPKEEKKKEGSVTLEYNRYPMSSYGMETQLEEEEFKDLMPWGWDESVGKQMNQGISMMNSTLWGFNKLMAFAVSTLVAETFHLDFIDGFTDEIGRAVKAIAGFGNGGFKTNGVWPYLVTFIISLTGVWAAYMAIIKRSTSAALSGILSSLLIITFALAFFTNADKLLGTVNNISNEIQNDMLNTAFSATTPGKYEEAEGIAAMRNQIFDVMVKQPYLLLNFGTTDEKAIEKEWDKPGSRVDTMLKTPFLSEERKDAVKYEVEELKNNNMKPGALIDRLIVIICVLIMNAVLAVTLSLLALSSLAYHVLAIVMTIFAPFALLVGVFPAFSRTATNVIIKLVHAFYMKIGLALLMTILFTISYIVYNVTDPKDGILILFILQIVCYVVVWFKRNEILNIITTPFAAARVNNNAGQNMSTYKKTYAQAKNYVNRVSAPFVRPQTRSLGERTGYNKVKTNPGIGVVSPMTHPSYAPSKKNNAQAKAPAEKTPVAPSSAVQSTNNKAPVVNKQQPVQKPDSPIQSEKPTNEQLNLQSLESTMDKGGWAHQTKESVRVKRKERLAAQAAALAQADSQRSNPGPVNRPTNIKSMQPTIHNWSDKNED